MPRCCQTVFATTAAIVIALVAVALAAGSAEAAELPAHDPISILIIGDEVNPWGLSAEELTQPADIEAALEAADSGISLVAGDAVLVDSQCIDGALAELASAEPPDVVIYFAHQAALACDGADAQPMLTAAIEAHLEGGGGVVVFHHGLYVAAGKETILALLGGRASAIDYSTDVGQRVFNVAPEHFITTNGIDYDGSAALSGGPGIPSGDFAYFDNIPDERYPVTELLAEAGEQRQLLFASDSGGARALGYTLVRPGWSGRVVFYQPAEYQPNALDDRDGNGFQVLANAIAYASGLESTGGQGDADAGSDPGDDGPAASGCCQTAPTGVPWGALVGVAFVLALTRRRRRPVLKGQKSQANRR